MNLDFIDSRQMRAFLVLAKEGSFTQAGKALHLTQSAISHAVRTLEEDLGCQLVIRQGRQVQLTAHGREMLKHAETIQLQMSQARSSLGSLDHNPRGRLRIGCTPAASQFILPNVLREFKDSFPLYDISIQPGETPENVKALEANELDLSICLKPRDTSHLNLRSLFEDELVMLSNAMHPWRDSSIKPKQLSSETFIVSNRSSLSFDYINEYFLKQGVRPKSIIELGNLEATKELTKIGIGIAIMAPWMAKRELAAGELVAHPLPKGRIRRQWVIASLKGKPQSLAEQTFAGICEEVGYMAIEDT